MIMKTIMKQSIVRISLLCLPATLTSIACVGDLRKQLSLPAHLQSGKEPVASYAKPTTSSRRKDLRLQGIISTPHNQNQAPVLHEPSLSNPTSLSQPDPQMSSDLDALHITHESCTTHDSCVTHESRITHELGVIPESQLQQSTSVAGRELPAAVATSQFVCEHQLGVMRENDDVLEIDDGCQGGSRHVDQPTDQQSMRMASDPSSATTKAAATAKRLLSERGSR